MLRLFFCLLVLPSLLRAAEEFGPYVEPDFPVLTSTVDFSDWEKQGFPKNNIAVRGLIIKLPHDLYVCFDQDLLRVAGIWQGEPGGKFLTFTTIPAISYNIENKKSEPGQKDLPKPIGKPIMATGLMPGWILKAAKDVKPEDLADPRPPGQDPGEPGRGPLPSWKYKLDSYIAGDKGGVGDKADEYPVLLLYTCGGTNIIERFRVTTQNGVPRLERHVRGGVYFRGYTGVEPSPVGTDPLTLAAGHAGVECTAPTATVAGTSLYEWPGQRDWSVFYSLPEVRAGGEQKPAKYPAQFNSRLSTSVSSGAVSGAFAVEEISLPVPNQWKRNVRPSGIAFFPDGRGVVCTIDGDVWILSSPERSPGKVISYRYASGLHEPQSVAVQGNEIFVFTRDGIVRLHDYTTGSSMEYRNFCNAFTQTGETREYPMDMVAKPGGGFYIAKGGQMITRKAPQGGHVLEISADGKTVTDICSGLRQPYLGIHPKTGLLTASDQQGHWTVSTPIRYIRKGAYYGFEEAAPNPIPSLIDPPACWIPHEVNQSAAGQVWAVDAKMGPLNDRLLHLMYFRPGILTAFLDPDKTQAAIAPTGLEFDFPLLKGAINPVDGLLYVCGFRIWGTESKNMAGLARVRPTGKPSAIPTTVRAVPQGIHLRFEQKLDPASLKPEHFAASRWNYKRTSGYGSAHYKLDGKPGMEPLPCVGAQLSADGMGLLVHLPDMKPAEQYRLDWRLTSAAGTPINSFTTLTLYSLTPFDAAAAGFDPSFKPSPPPPITAAVKEEPTMETGQQLINTLGCLACHSTDGKMEGMKGPTWKDLFGSENELVNGKKVTADIAYLRESILKPAANVRKGFNNPDVGMPPYEGILNDSQVESIILYLRSLSSR